MPAANRVGGFEHVRERSALAGRVEPPGEKLDASELDRIRAAYLMTERFAS